ncbi:multi-sensor hybrid histidine kinase [Chthoniobacter flavus Ellin428]|uniref:histidine kinase n=2 Tax=Chthoniobacter flavus TaxID=191863 RepID=B4CYV6_9BACT|nr:multi-sensor hybrid histidine kinase [Chthoniobacter flavus Ellin428]TCO89845.1 PAS domain S-box-containing protein [Chthoniobacter flavus]
MRILTLGCIVLLGMSCALVAFFLTRNSERERAEQEFAWRTRRHLEALRVNLERSEECLYTLRDLFQSTGGVSYSEFQRTAQDLRRRHQGVQQLQWVPRIKAEDRATFEAFARSTVSPTFEIIEGDEEHHVNVRAAPRAEYAPVMYVDPKSGNEASFGIDSYRGTHQQTIFHARDTGTIAATRRILLRGKTTEYGWACFLPLYAKGPGPTTTEARRERLLGYIVGTFRLTDWIASSFPETKSSAVEAMIVDETPGTPERFLVSFSGGVARTPPPNGEAAFATGLRSAAKLSVGGRDWTVLFRASPAWLSAQATPYSYAAPFVVLLITALVAFLVHHIQRRAEVVGRLVEERTAALHAVEETLRGDIRRRELVESALRKSEDRYRAFVGQSTEGIWCFEHETPISTHLPAEEQIDLMYRNARLTECNDVMARIYGHERSDQIIGAPLDSFAPREDPQNIAFLRAFIENRYRVVEWEMREVDKDGTPRFFLSNQTGIIEDGLLKRVWGTRREITERKREAELQAQQATRLRLAVSAASLGTWDWDLATQRVLWSPETERMFGLAPGTFDGTLQTYMSFLFPEDRERIGIIIRHALETPGETGTDYDLHIQRPDGTTRWLVARGAVLRDVTGKPVRMLGTVMDVTHQRLAEEERVRMERKLQEGQKLESLGVLAGGIAHDFNNLLTGILGNASFARMDIPANSPAQPSLEQVEIAAQRAAELCKQMLAYSGKGRFVVQRLDLSSLVRETSDLLQVSISKNCVMKFALAEDLPAINADATQIRQIIMNLVINASEAIGDRSGSISVTTGVMDADRAYLSEAHLSPNIPEGEYAFLEVSDNGTGMTPETRAKIFDPFFTTKFTGRGLGLAAVLGIVRGHSGALKVNSEVGRGTIFKLLLPCADGPSENTSALPSPLITWRGSGTMLVVDDEDTVRATMTRMLERVGFDVLQAANGHQALEIFHREEEKIVGVLLDLTMPLLDGNATFTELRRCDPDVRVLLMSGFNEQDAVHRFAGKGLAGFIQKPFKPETLYSKLQSIFENEPSREKAEPLA